MLEAGLGCGQPWGVLGGAGPLTPGSLRAPFRNADSPSVTCALLQAPANSSRSLDAWISHTDFPGDYAVSNDQLKQIGQVPQAPKSWLIPGTSNSHCSLIMWQSPGWKHSVQAWLFLHQSLPVSGVFVWVSELAVSN